jgi:hypothetical protein
MNEGTHEVMYEVKHEVTHDVLVRGIFPQDGKK